MLNYFGLMDLPAYLESFASLYYPTFKVVECSEDNSRAVACLEHRDATSISNLQKLADANPAFNIMLEFAVEITDDTNQDKKEIMLALQRELNQ
jgi:hypothetical protein